MSVLIRSTRGACLLLLVPVVCLDDILYRCIVFSISNFVDALMIKMKT
jgi:hypothetical protein